MRDTAGKSKGEHNGKHLPTDLQGQTREETGKRVLVDFLLLTRETDPGIDRCHRFGGSKGQTDRERKVIDLNLFPPRRKIARIFEEPTGKFHICDDGLDYLDARGTGYDTRRHAIGSLRRSEYSRYVSESGKVVKVK